MKIFVAFLIIIASVTGSEEPKKWEAKHGENLIKIRKECLKKFKFTEDQFNSMQDFKLVDEEPVRRYLLCLAERLGIFEDGKLIVDRIIDQYKMHLEVNDVSEMVEQCVDKVKSDTEGEVVVYNFYVCLFDTEIGKTIQNAVKKPTTQASK